MTLEQIAYLITQADDTTPNLKTIVRRQRAGNPIDQMRVSDVRQGLRELRAAIDRAEQEMS